VIAKPFSYHNVSLLNIMPGGLANSCPRHGSLGVFKDGGSAFARESGPFGTLKEKQRRMSLASLDKTS
jgi:hypothetical protein